MIPARQVILVAALLLLAAVLQGRLAHAMAIRGAQPDFLLVLLACGATLVGSIRGAFLGIWSGLLTAAVIPKTFGSYLVSRTLAGWLAGSLQRSVIRDSLVVPPLVVLVTTLLAELLYVAMAPRFAIHHLRPWAQAVGGEIVYNMALSLPVYFSLRRLGVGLPREDPFATSSPYS